jgi:hypothetical protein
MKEITVGDHAPSTWDGQAALVVTGLEGIESMAASLAEQMGISVEVASTRAAAVRLLDRRSYAVLVVDQMLADSDPEGAELIWKGAGLAVPIEMNFALAATGRVEREVRAALRRRQKETQLATAAAATALDTELKNAVTGMLLESQLALAETGLPPHIETRLRTLAAIAGRLRERLAATPARPAASAGLQAARG